MAKGQNRFNCRTCNKICSGRQCRECFHKKGSSASTRRGMRRYNEKVTKLKKLEEYELLGTSRS